jgi:hypothetical protein
MNPELTVIFNFCHKEGSSSVRELGAAGVTSFILTVLRICIFLSRSTMEKEGRSG